MNANFWLTFEFGIKINEAKFGGGASDREVYANAMGYIPKGPTIKSSKSEEANKSVPPKRLVKMDKFMLG